MHYSVVENYPMPDRLSGHRGLELFNTWAGWGEPLPRDEPEREAEHRSREYLYDFDRLAVWTGHVGLIVPDRVPALRSLAAQEPEAAASVLLAVQRFRDAGYEVVLGRDHLDRAPDPLHLVTSTIETARSSAKLVRRSNGDFVLEQPVDHLVSCLWVVASALEEVLVDPAVRRSVHACPGPQCGWLFVDPRHRRRWCSMSSCGNRAKARAHAQRQRRAASPG